MSSIARVAINGYGRIGRNKVESGTHQLPQRDLSSLRNSYNTWRDMAKNERSTRLGVSDTIKGALSDSLNQLLEAVPDETRRGVLRVLHDHDRDLDAVFEAQGENCADLFKGDALIVLKSLSGEIYKGKQDEYISLKVPYSAEEMLIWLLHLARNTTPTKSARESLSAGLAQSVKNGVICGRTREELGLTDEEMQSLYRLTVIPLLIDDDYVPHFSLLADIAATVPGGEELLKGVIVQSRQGRNVHD